MHRMIILRSRAGQSLIELLVGIVIGTIVIGGAAAIIIPSIQTSQQVKQISAGTNLANELLQNVRSWTAGNWTSFISSATGTANTYYLNTASSPFTLVAAGNATSVGWSNGYTYRRTITFSATQVSSTQTNFPVLISGTYSYLAATSTGGLVQNAAGNDIVFSSDPAGSALLNWEVESYASTTGAVNYWVQVPSLAPNSLIYMFYGKTGVNATLAHASSTWSSNYAAVYHFPSGVAVTFPDSLSKNNLTNNIGTATSGVIGSAVNFGGSGYAYNTSPSGLPSGSAARSVEAWVRLGSSTLGQEIAGWGNNTGGNGARWELDWNGSAGNSNMCVETLNGGTCIPQTYDNNWHFLVATNPSGNASATGVSMYLDGLSFTNTYASGTLNTATSNIDLGTLAGSVGSANFTGAVDEVRLLSVALSPSWIVTEYNNQTSPSTFYTIGAQGTGSVGEVVAVGTSTYTRYFYISDIYRTSSGTVSSTGDRDYSTKQVTVVANVLGGTTSTQTVLTQFVVHTQINSLTQSDWSGGPVATSASTYASNVYSTSTNIVYSTPGRLDLTTSSGTYTASGTLDSQTFDLGYSTGTQLNSIVWQGTQGGGGVNLTVAASNSSSGPWNYLAYITGNPGTFITLKNTSGTIYLFGNYRYFRYRLQMIANNSTTPAEPVVNDVTVNWSP